MGFHSFSYKKTSYNFCQKPEMRLLKRIYRLLQPEERKNAWLVAATVFVSALLNFISLAAMLPILYFLLEGGDNKQAALLFCLLTISVILIKTLTSLFFTRYQQRYLLGFYKRLSFSLFSAYYRQGLLFIREQGSNKLGYEVNALCYAFSQNLLALLLRMGGDILLILFVTVALLIYDGTTVLMLYVAFLPFMLIYLISVRKHVKKYGRMELEAKREQSRMVIDTFRGFTELEVSGAFPSLQASFLKGMDKVSTNRIKMNTILQLPLFLTELSVIIALALLVAFGDGDVKLLVGIFAVASFRLLPALRGLLSGWTQIQNNISCLDIIERGLEDEEKSREISEEEDMTFEKAITIENLTYAYPNSTVVLRNFNCSITKGEYIGWRGSSGIGKSTLFNLLIGLLTPTSGTVSIDKVPLTAKNRKAWLKHIGYVPQEVFIFKGTLAENIALGCKYIDKEKIKEILGKVSLDNWVSSLPQGLDTELGEAGGKLSGGQKQRIGIARALYKEADVLFLDEATSALDNLTENEVNETLLHLRKNCKGLTILSIAHRDSSLSYCDRIIKLK